jgi:hypothetical protein
LSTFWLTAMATANIPVPAELLPHVSCLVAARSLNPQYKVTPRGVKQLFEGAPASWALPQRAIQPVNSVLVTWNVDIDALRHMVERSIAEGAVVKEASSFTPPLAGTRYQIVLSCKPNNGSCCIGLLAVAVDVPHGLCWSFKFMIQISGTRLVNRTQAVVGIPEQGWEDFGLPRMAGRWDEEAWAALGLPLCGNLPITLTVCAQPPRRAAPGNAPRDPDPAAGSGGR